jgi:hypothetical protein
MIMIINEICEELVYLMRQQGRHKMSLSLRPMHLMIRYKALGYQELDTDFNYYQTRINLKNKKDRILVP